MKCGTHSCASDAAVRVYWPGRPINLCLPCAARAANIAQAVGFVLSVGPLPPPCACKAIDAGLIGFCRDHRRACIPADADETERQLVIALAASADIPLSTAADGSRVGGPS